MSRLPVVKIDEWVLPDNNVVEHYRVGDWSMETLRDSRGALIQDGDGSIEYAREAIAVWTAWLEFLEREESSVSSEAAQNAHPERVLPLYPEPPIGTWARDRFGGITYRQANGGWGQPGVMPVGKWEAMYEARGPYVETGRWGKPLGSEAMSTRDEAVAAVVQALGGEAIIDPIPAGIAVDALIAEGWRKKPTTAEVSNLLAGIPYNEDPAVVARAVLALMDRGQ